MSRLDAHYDALRQRPGIEPVDFDLGPLPADRLRRRFVAADDPGTVASAFDRTTLIATGIGMTGPPHLGTVGQLYTAIELQAAGLDVQLVLADLEPYHGGRADLDTVCRRAARYRRLALDLGFDPEQGRLRTQTGATDVLQTAAVLAPYYDRSELEPESVPRTEWEQAVEDTYERRGRNGEGPTSETARRLSGLLHGADFLHPLAEAEYDTVVVTMGADEYRLVPWTRAFLAAAPVEGTVAGLYTRLLTGVNDAPKMGRSLPGSGLALGDDPDRLREWIERAEPRTDPSASVIVQATRLAAPGDAFDPERVEAACRNGGEEWDTITSAYAEHVAGLAERWQSYRVDPSGTSSEGARRT